MSRKYASIIDRWKGGERRAEREMDGWMDEVGAVR